MLEKKKMLPAHQAGGLTYRYTCHTERMYTVTIDVPHACVKPISESITEKYRATSEESGLVQPRLPKKFTADYYQKEIARDGARYIFDHFVQHAIFDALASGKITSINQPHIESVSGSLKKGFTYAFTICTMPDRDVSTWRRISFRPARRKRYSDLEDQAREFIAKEFLKDSKTVVDTYDWVVFTAEHVDLSHNLYPATAYPYYLMFPHLPNTTPLSSALYSALAAGVRSVPLKTLSLFDLEEATSETKGIVLKNIRRIAVQGNTIPALARFFYTKNEHELHELVIELFSTLDDLPLRKALYVEMLHSLRKAFRCEISPHAITRRKESLLHALRQSEETKVYLKTPDFAKHLTQLAEQQIQEEFLVDMIAECEKISPTDDEIEAYLHIVSHEKTRSLIHFTPPIEAYATGLKPCNHELIREAARREKTLTRMLQAFR